MAKYLTELNYKDTIYTIVDRDAQSKLKNKADLVNGFLVETQLPPTALTDTRFTSVTNDIYSKIDTINDTLANKADNAAVASFVTTQDVRSMMDSAHADMITVTVLDQKLANYINKTEANDYITIAVEDVLDEALDNALSGIMNQYLTITVAEETYAKKSEVSGILESAKQYTDEQLEGFSPGTLDYTSLQNKPTINGVTVQGTLTTESLNIIFPENISYFTNDKGYITEEQDPVWSAEKASYATKEYTLAVVQNTNSAIITRKGPTTITKPATAELLLDISSFNNAVISAFSIDTTEGELFIPLFSDQGVLKILKTKQEVTDEETAITSTLTVLTLTLSDTLFNMEWTNGYIYFSQFMDTGDSADTYWVDDYGTLFIVDANADGNPDIDSSQGILSLSSDNYTDISINDGVLEITTDS